MKKYLIPTFGVLLIVLAVAIVYFNLGEVKSNISVTAIKSGVVTTPTVTQEKSAVTPAEGGSITPTISKLDPQGSLEEANLDKVFGSEEAADNFDDIVQ
jgi:hypothetical protein